MSTYYVHPNGSNYRTGTEAAPWKTLDYALRKLRPGDTLVVRGGQYVSPSLAAGATMPGENGRGITVEVMQGEAASFVGPFKVNAAHWWTLRRITFNGAANPNSRGIADMVHLRHSDYWMVEDCELYSRPGANSGNVSTELGGYKALLAITGQSPTVQRCVVCDNPGIYPKVEQDAAGNGINQDHLLYVSGGVEAWIERNVLVGAPNGRAVKIGAAKATEAPPQYAFLYGNTIVDCPGPAPVMFSYGATGDVVANLIVSAVSSGTKEIISSTNATPGVKGVAQKNWGYSPNAADLFLPGLLRDEHGNVWGIDPQLDAQYVPRNPALAINGVIQFGHRTGEMG